MYCTRWISRGCHPQLVAIRRGDRHSKENVMATKALTCVGPSAGLRSLWGTMHHFSLCMFVRNHQYLGSSWQTYHKCWGKEFRMPRGLPADIFISYPLSVAQDGQIQDALLLQKKEKRLMSSCHGMNGMCIRLFWEDSQRRGCSCCSTHSQRYSATNPNSTGVWVCKLFFLTSLSRASCQSCNPHNALPAWLLALPA